MLTPRRQRELMQRAEQTARAFTSGGVTRAELSPVLNVLFLTPTPWPDRLARGRQLAEELPSSWVSARSNQTGPRLALVRAQLREVFRAGLPEEELRFLLGWAARIVHVHAERRREEQKEGADHRDERHGASPRRQR